ncbi:MAG: MauE/DoxX family redox-associated membrane protein [Nitrospinales bacterium]
MNEFSKINKITLIILRYFIASVLLFTGLGKLLDIPGFVLVLRTYQAIPQWALYLVAIGTTLFELRVSEWLFRDKTLRLGSVASLFLHSIFTLWATATLLREIPVPNCGCFGVFLARPLTIWTVVEDLVMVIASWILLKLVNKKTISHYYKNRGLLYEKNIF